ncbi:MAG: glycosyltransferase, partial [bacterium]
MELFILTAGVSQPEVIQRANLLARQHPKIHTIRCEYEDFDRVLEESHSDFICLMESGDRLRPHAVGRLASAISVNGADIAYADEVILTASGNRVHKFVLRPAFCLDHFLNQPCIGLMTAIRRELLAVDEPPADCKSVEVLNEKLILHALASAETVVHLPDFIFERLSPKTIPKTRRLPPSFIEKFINRCGFEHATVRPTASPTLYSIRYNHPVPGKTAIIIPTKNQGQLLELAVQSLERTVPEELYHLVVIDHESDDRYTQAYLSDLAKKHQVISYQGVFNFSKINNFAVTKLDGIYDSFLFMNNDVEAIHTGWFESMRDKLGRCDVGIVGAVLLFPPKNVGASSHVAGPNREPDASTIRSDQQTTYTRGETFFSAVQLDNCKIQHGGVMLGVGIAEHYLKYEEYQNTYLEGPSLNPTLPSPVTRRFSAVTAACMMTRRNVFEDLGGFDENLAIAYQDVDLCLRTRDEGRKVLCDAEAVLFHHESVSRSTKDYLLGDPHPEDSANFRSI